MDIRLAEERAREAMYQRYDAAVASLSPDRRHRASIHGFHEDSDGSWRIIDPLGALVGERRSVESMQREAAMRPTKALYPKQMQAIARAEAEHLVSQAMSTFAEALGKTVLAPMQRKIDELHTEKAIDAIVIDELAGCLERVAALEKSEGGHRVKALGESEQNDLDARINAALERHAVSRALQGRGVQSALIDRDGELVLAMTDGSTQKLGRVVGRDGLSLESRELEYCGATHEIIERWTVAGAKREFRYPAGGIRDRGYWHEGMQVRAGEAVTHGGTLWIALCDTKAKPCHENKADWRVGARRGRDAKEIQ